MAARALGRSCWYAGVVALLFMAALQDHNFYIKMLEMVAAACLCLGALARASAPCRGDALRIGL
eukprot:2375009-Alexandrium_andersonii.AAC.1